MIQTKKIIKVGNSGALTLDAEYMRMQNANVGEEMVTRYSDDGVFVAVPLKVLQKLEGSTQEAKIDAVSSKITPELLTWTADFLQKHEVALKKLANL